MYNVKRRYVNGEEPSPLRSGHYEYYVVESEGMPWDDNVIDEFGWMPENEYREWKQSIIKENFPHSE